MSVHAIRISRLYLTEGDQLLSKIISYLHDEEKLAGVTVYRAIEGFGQSGEIHQSSLVDLTFDLPLVVEFYDTPEKILAVMASLKEKFPGQRIVSWLAEQF